MANLIKKVSGLGSDVLIPLTKKVRLELAYTGSAIPNTIRIAGPSTIPLYVYMRYCVCIAYQLSCQYATIFLPFFAQSDKFVVQYLFQGAPC